MTCLEWKIPMKRLFLSIVFTWTGLHVLPGCKFNQEVRPYYDIYDEAVFAYFLDPTDPPRALKVLDEACSSNPDHQDVSCYNYGVLLELENRKAEALASYRRANNLHPSALYREAIQSLSPDPAASSTIYLQLLQGLTSACQEKNQPRIEGLIVRLKESVKRGEIVLTRQVMEQPFFSECLKETADRTWTASLPSRTDDLGLLLIRYRAAKSDFASIWDMELFMRGLQGSVRSRNPLTGAWQTVIDSARGGNSAGAARALRVFYSELAAFETRLPDRRNELLALRRAAAVIITREDLFARIKNNEEVLRLIRPYL